MLSDFASWFPVSWLTLTRYPRHPTEPTRTPDRCLADPTATIETSGQGPTELWHRESESVPNQRETTRHRLYLRASAKCSSRAADSFRPGNEEEKQRVFIRASSQGT